MCFGISLGVGLDLVFKNNAIGAGLGVVKSQYFYIRD